MTAELSVAAKALTDHARTTAGGAIGADALSRYLPRLVIPAADWGTLPFGPEVNARWSTAIAHRITETTAARDLLNTIASGLLAAANDYSQTDTDLAVDLAHTTALDGDSDLRPLLSRQYSPSATVTPGPGVDFTSIRTGDDLPEPLDPTVHLDSTGRDAMLAFRSEHLGTLERAEELLRDADRLDFKAPSQYLGEVAEVRPGAVRNRAQLLRVVSANLTEINAETQASATTLNTYWQGGQGVESFTDRSAVTTEFLAELAGRLGWLYTDGTGLWQLLDGLLQGITDDAQAHLDSVQDSRIGRIRSAVELVEEIGSRTLTTEGGPDLLWGNLSSEDTDAAIQVLYKRVWYLANAFDTTMSKAAQGLDTLIDNATHPQIAIPGSPSEDSPPDPVA